MKKLSHWRSGLGQLSSFLVGLDGGPDWFQTVQINLYDKSARNCIQAYHNPGAVLFTHQYTLQAGESSGNNPDPLSHCEMRMRHGIPVVHSLADPADLLFRNHRWRILGPNQRYHVGQGKHTSTFGERQSDKDISGEQGHFQGYA